MADVELGQKKNNASSLFSADRKKVFAHEIIKTYVVEICQLLFSDEALGFKWDPDESKTQIRISDKYSFNLESVQTTPAIVANRGPQAWANATGFRQLQSIDLKTDTRIHTDLVNGGVTLSVFCRQGLEAEMIAGLLFEFFQAGRDVLRTLTGQGIVVPRHLAGFFRVAASTMGEEALVSSDSRPEISVVPVAIRATVQRRWSTQPNARRLRGMNTRLTKVNGETIIGGS